MGVGRAMECVCVCGGGQSSLKFLPGVWFYWGLMPQQQSGSYQGGELMKCWGCVWEEVGVPGNPQNHCKLSGTSIKTHRIASHQVCS